VFKAITNPNDHRWIMVSGAPRSGTSFVGTVLGMPWSVNTIYEPFNPLCGVEWNEQRYLYLKNASLISKEQRVHLEDFFDYNFNLKLVHSPRDHALIKVVKNIVGGGNQLSLTKARLNPFAKVSLIKDPIAVFLAELFFELRQVHTVFLIRHPLSFVGSLKRLGWRFNVNPFLQQPHLLQAYVPELAHQTVDPGDWIAGSAWVWTAINRYVLDVAATNAAMTISVHEAVSSNPVPELRRLFDFFNLQWSPGVERFVVKSSSAEGKGRAKEGVIHDFRRSSAAIFNSSVDVLDEEEKRRVLEICWPTARNIYRFPDREDVLDDYKIG
jgi:hypothetical protein